MKIILRNQIKPFAYYMYVDDVFAVFPIKNDVTTFFTMLKKMHKCRSFTVEEETSRKIHFLLSTSLKIGTTPFLHIYIYIQQGRNSVKIL